MNNNVKRLDWIDMTKGLAIILVLLVHLNFNTYSVVWIGSFIVTLFFIVSGFLFSEGKSFKDFLYKRIKTLIIPYFLLGIPLTISFTIYSHFKYNAGFDFLENFKCLLIQNRYITLWFTSTLFLVYILYYLINKFIKNDIGKLLVSIISIFIGIFIHKFYTSLPWNIDLVFYTLPFFYVGHMYKKYYFKFEKIENNKNNIYLLIVINLIINIVCALISYNKYKYAFSLFGNQFGIIWLSYISAIAGSFFVIYISKLINVKFIRYLGENTLLYYSWHQYLAFPIAEFLLSPLKGIIDINNLTIIYVLLICVLTIGLLTIFNYLLSNSKLKFVLGK